MDCAVAIGEHDHGWCGNAGEHAVEGRSLDAASNELTDVQVLRIGEEANVRTAFIPSELVWPGGERVVDKLEDALIPRVRKEELDGQAARGQIPEHSVAQARHLCVFLGARLDQAMVDLAWA